MIRPSKYLDLKTCTLRVASVVISALHETSPLPLPELDETVQSRLGEEARFNFVPALNFLYLVGAIDYNAHADAVVLNR